MICMSFHLYTALCPSVPMMMTKFVTNMRYDEMVEVDAVVVLMLDFVKTNGTHDEHHFRDHTYFHRDDDHHNKR